MRPSIQRVRSARPFWHGWLGLWTIVLAAVVFGGQASGEGTKPPLALGLSSNLPVAQIPLIRNQRGNVVIPWHLPGETNGVLPAESNARQPEDFEAQLEIARHHRAARQFAEATTICGWILEKSAPQPLQQSALQELAEMARDQGDLMRAQQVYAQWLTRWPQDIRVPEMILYQGLIFRQMGLNNLAIVKFYAVMTSALVIKSDKLDFYQQLVLRAQNEIAETQYELGNYADAVDSFGRLLKLDPPPINRSAIHYQYIQCLTGLGRRSEAIAQAQDFLDHNPDAAQRPEVHFIRATALKEARREGEALQQVLALLQEQHDRTNCTSQILAFWQRRAGNAIANQFYQEGDHIKALEIYQRLAALDDAVAWRLPVEYQMGLVYERLAQPARAVECYSNIIAREKAAHAEISPGLKTVVEMAGWRRDFLEWQLKTERTNLGFRAASLGPETPTKPSPPPLDP